MSHDNDKSNNSTNSSSHETDQLIERLSNHLEPQVTLQHPAAVALPWLSLSVIYTVLVIYIHGVRGDFSGKMLNTSFMLELTFASAITISACFSSIWLKSPDVSGHARTFLAPIFIAVTFLAIGAVSIIEHGFHMPALTWHPCHTQAIIFGLIPSALIIYFSTKGKTTHPYLLSFMNTLAVGGLGYISLRIACGSDDMGHICMYHVVPFAVLSLIMTLFANKLYKW